jgi:hypothetical protein
MQRNKGARAERAAVNHLHERGYPDARRYLAGDGNQPGDIDCFPGIVIEVKNQARYDLPAWLRQADVEAGSERLPMVLVKPVGVVDVGCWWAVMRFDDWLELAAGS